MLTARCGAGRTWSRSTCAAAMRSLPASPGLLELGEPE